MVWYVPLASSSLVLSCFIWCCCIVVQSGYYILCFSRLWSWVYILVFEIEQNHLNLNTFINKTLLVNNNIISRVRARMMTWRRVRSKIHQTGRSDHAPSAGSLLKVCHEEQLEVFNLNGLHCHIRDVWIMLSCGLLYSRWSSRFTVYLLWYWLEDERPWGSVVSPILCGFKFYLK